MHIVRAQQKPSPICTVCEKKLGGMLSTLYTRLYLRRHSISMSICSFALSFFVPNTFVNSLLKASVSWAMCCLRSWWRAADALSRRGYANDGWQTKLYSSPNDAHQIPNRSHAPHSYPQLRSSLTDKSEECKSYTLMLRPPNYHYRCDARSFPELTDRRMDSEMLSGPRHELQILYFGVRCQCFFGSLVCNGATCWKHRKLHVKHEICFFENFGIGQTTTKIKHTFDVKLKKHLC